MFSQGFMWRGFGLGLKFSVAVGATLPSPRCPLPAAVHHYYTRTL